MAQSTRKAANVIMPLPGRLLNLKLRALKPGETSVALRSAKAISATAESTPVAELPVHRIRITAGS